MLKKLTLTLTFMLFSLALLQAQSLTLTTYGQSERDVELDSLDMFDQVYDGLQNVGINSKVYLKASLDSAFTNPTWTFPTKPAGSAAALGEPLVVDEMTQIIAFTPDVVGNYIVEFSQGSGDIVTINIHAGTFIGIDGGSISCTTCHSDIGDKWSATGHATTLDEQLKGEGSDHFASYCVSCHSTGYNVNADNDGFDDRDFVFPDTLSPEAYDEVLANSPEAMKLANVQCESCHGPASEHNGATSNLEVVTTLSSDNCAVCHDSGVHNVLPAQWDVSRHANPLYADYAGGRSGCADCHSGAGFVAAIKGETEIPEATAITCATCHDPHDATNTHQLRTVSVSLSNGTEVSGGGSGQLCMNCHKSRRDAIDYTDNYLSNLSSHFGPHHGPQAEVLLGQNLVTFGKTIESTNHFAILDNACASCHMKVTESVDAENNVILSGGHTFSMSTPSGEDNVEACAPCHSFESFDAVEFEMDGVKDHDGDGVDEGLQEEIHGLLERIIEYIPHDEDGLPAITDSTVTQLQAQAAYNYLAIEEDRSFGIHNPKFAVGLLKETLAQLEATSVEKTDFLPIQYSLKQNYPNPFNPTTVINFSIPKSGDVKLTVFDALGREVEMLVNEKMESGNYNIDWDATNYAAGIYFYSINVNDFVSTKKMVLLK